MLGDYTTEGLNNVGSNFSLVAFSTTGPAIGTWLSIARADGSVSFNGSGVTVQGSLAVNGLLILASPNNLAIYGGAAGDVLSTGNGSGVLLGWLLRGAVVAAFLTRRRPARPMVENNVGAWTPTVSFPEAPPDGQYYARRQLAWQPIPPGGATISDNCASKPFSRAIVVGFDRVQLYVTTTTAIPVSGFQRPTLSLGRQARLVRMSCRLALRMVASALLVRSVSFAAPTTLR